MTVISVLCVFVVMTYCHSVSALALGEKCDQDIECVVPSDLKQETMWCYGGQCACRQGFTRERDRCVIGGDCTTDSDCSQLEKSFCNITLYNRSRCTCRDSYLAAANNSKCLPTVQHNGTCEETIQCNYSKETECRDGKCQCTTNSEYKGNLCVKKLGIGSGCSTSTDCEGVKETVCRNGVCTCLDSYVPAPNNSICILSAQHEGKCEETIQCNYSNETECRDGICQCKANFNYNGARCVGSLALGEKCYQDIECVVPFDLKQETVWCYNGQCGCKQGFTREGDRCVIGGDCTSNSDCSQLENSFCNTTLRSRFRCGCQDSFIPVANNTKCLPLVHEIGTGCDYNEQCSSKLGKAECRNNQCQCAEGATLNKEDNTCGAAVVHVMSLSCLVVIWIAKLF